MSVRILIGDCRDRMAELPDASVDSVVCDPPYHLTSIVKRFGSANAAPAKVGKTGAYARASRGFMGQTWDGGDVAFQPELWAEVLRVMKPGAHLVAFSGTRTYHRMACAIEDAGLEIRDQLAWTYGSGFPKSHNLEGEWQGWGTALKPAWEPICLARKPLIGTVAANVLAHGCGGLNIDGCRIQFAGAADEAESKGKNRHADFGSGARENRIYNSDSKARGANGNYDPPGRFPANLLHDGSPEVLAGFPDARSYCSKAETAKAASGKTFGAETNAGREVYGTFAKGFERGQMYADSGSAARFFYCAKADKEDRGEGNNHPTVKPQDLMRWLVRLVTPKGGTVLDPFAGSGSTLVAADIEGMDAIGCELSPEYAAIAERRVRASAGMFAQVRAA